MCEKNYQSIIEAQKGNKKEIESLVKNNMGLVYSITRRFKDRGHEMEDLNQIGAMGLIKAIKNFNIEYDVKLSTYCVPYILGEIKRYIRDDGKIKVSRSIKELATKINLIKKEYLEKNNKEISIEEISEVLKIPKEDIAFAIDATASNVVTSIDEPINNNENENTCLLDTLKSNKNEENEIINKMALEKVINELDDREKNIIMLRYFNEKTQMEVSKILGISQVQVSRIEKRLLLKMREKIS